MLEKNGVQGTVPTTSNSSAEAEDGGLEQRERRAISSRFVPQRNGTGENAAGSPSADRLLTDGGGGGESEAACCILLAAAALSLSYHSQSRANGIGIGMSMEQQKGEDQRGKNNHGSTTGSVSPSVTACESHDEDEPHNRETECDDEDGWFGAADGDKEAFGSWGFRDAGFALSAEKDDASAEPHVVMRGAR